MTIQKSMDEKELLKYIEKYAPNLEYSNTIYEILEGALLDYIHKALRQQISGNSFNVAIQRAAPINILIKIISKLSKLYSWPVIRTTDNPIDQELIDYYTKEGLNLTFQNFNENFNSTKRALIEIYEDDEERKIGFRAIPAKNYLPITYSSVDKTRMSAYVKIMDNNRLHYIDKDSFKAFNKNGEPILQDTEANLGINPYEVVPAVYQARSDYELIPKDDTDTIPMAILIPLLLTDMNFASMFLSNPIIIGIDIESPENQQLSPNFFWNAKSSSVDGKTGSLSVLKAEPNLDAQMKNAIDQLQLWLSTRDIRPGTVSSTATETFSAAISKIIGEMDTIENINAQKEYMLKAEKDFWFKLATIHNKIAPTGRIDERRMFTDPASLVVNVNYSEPTIIESKLDKVNRLKTEIDAGLQSKAGALKELYPKETDDQINQRLLEINTDKSFSVPSEQDMTNMDQMPME
jgi:hypothetical protein